MNDNPAATSDEGLIPELQSIPDEPWVYRVETLSGTVHIISTIGRFTWKRLPAPTAGAGTYDGQAVTLTEMSDLMVGKRGVLIVSDSSYLSGQSMHSTARITRITREPKAL